MYFPGITILGDICNYEMMAQEEAVVLKRFLELLVESETQAKLEGLEMVNLSEHSQLLYLLERFAG